MFPRRDIPLKERAGYEHVLHLMPGIPRTMALKAGRFLFKSSKSRLRNSGPEAVVERTFLQASPVRT